MWRKALGVCTLALALGAAGRPALAACQIKMFAEFQLEPRARLRPLIQGAVNGRPALILADTGAFGSTITSDDAAKAGVSPEQIRGLQVYGIGGKATARAANFDLRLGKLELKNETLVVLDSRSPGPNIGAVVGRNVLAQHDYELDMPDHAIRLLKPEGCKAEELAYWAKPYSQVRIEGYGDRPAIIVTAMLNGHAFTAMVDSGSPVSFVTPEAAAVAGLKFESDQPTGTAGGIGADRIPIRLATFDSFSLGDETIKDSRIRVADLWRNNVIEDTGSRLGKLNKQNAPKILIGADFLAVHRVFVANSQQLLLFSYMGGPVFDITSQARPAQAAPATDQPAASTAPTTPGR